LSYPQIRNAIRDSLTRLIKENFPEASVIAGVATGAIAQGVLIAQELNLPFVYVRSTPKKHGMENLIEGEIRPKQKVVVVEDLISTGNSSLMAVEVLRKAGVEVLGMVAIFTYGFVTAEQNFKNADCKLLTITNYEQLLEVAVPEGYITASQLDLLKEWRMNPATWMQE